MELTEHWVSNIGLCAYLRVCTKVQLHPYEYKETGGIEDPLPHIDDQVIIVSEQIVGKLDGSRQIQ